jgi:hypothetical protein
MDTVKDFEDILFILGKHRAQYIIIGGLAFIFHAKPRYTKDIDLWINPNKENVKKINLALAEFGSPVFVSIPVKPEEIVQLGLAPNRIDILLTLPGIRFKTAWEKRIKSPYGRVMANWINLDTLIRIKEKIKHPRHEEDVRVLKQVKKLKRIKSRKL